MRGMRCHSNRAGFEAVAAGIWHRERANHLAAMVCSAGFA